jgi:uncharacterized protein (TIGR03382 family)
VVYDQDDRTDLYAIEAPLWRERAASTVALVPPDLLSIEADSVTYESVVYGEHFDLCPGEAFFDQPRLGRCSGTLVDDDVVLTAGHCIEDQDECDSRRVVFDWAISDPDAAPVLTPDSIYTCAEILTTVDTDGDHRVDYTFIRLDRAPERPIAPLRQEDAPFALNTSVAVIGYPNGIPLKYAPNGAVINPRAEQVDFFEATLDTFGGNSGSGVFNDAGEVVGILVRGERDYETTDDGCDIVNVLSSDRTIEEGAEDVTYIARALEGLCRTGHRGARLCAPGDQTWCYPCLLDADCREGWTCDANADNPEQRSCAAPCAGDDDCRADHTCQNQRCHPRQTLTCNGPDVWSKNRCGHLIAPVFVCDPDQRCGGQACEPAPQGDRCQNPIVLDPVNQQVVGDMEAEDFSAQARGTCAGNGPEAIFAFTVEEPTQIIAEATGYDTVLHLRAGCDGEELACNDDHEPPGERGAHIEAELPPGEYRLFLDAFNFNVGAYTLNLTFAPTGCAEACLEGATECREADVYACVISDGCPTWQLSSTCDDDTQCLDGECLPGPDAGPLEDMGVDAELALDLGLPEDMSVADLGVDLGRPDLAVDAGAVDAARADATPADAAPGDGALADAGSRSGGGGGCQSGPSGPTHPLLLLGLPFLALLRRRRSAH